MVNAAEDAQCGQDQSLASAASLTNPHSTFHNPSHAHHSFQWQSMACQTLCDAISCDDSCGTLSVIPSKIDWSLLVKWTLAAACLQPEFPTVTCPHSTPHAQDTIGPAPTTNACVCSPTLCTSIHPAVPQTYSPMSSCNDGQSNVDAYPSHRTPPPHHLHTTSGIRLAHTQTPTTSHGHMVANSVLCSRR